MRSSNLIVIFMGVVLAACTPPRGDEENRSERIVGKYKIIRSERINDSNWVITNFYRDESRIRHDAIELDPQYSEVFARINEEAGKIFRIEYPVDRYGGTLGSKRIFWHKKKEILKEKYNIEWRPPSEMNPLVLFD